MNYISNIHIDHYGEVIDFPAPIHALCLFQSHSILIYAFRVIVYKINTFVINDKLKFTRKQP